MAKISGTIKPTGVRVMEAYDIQMDLKGADERFGRDPAGFVRQFLEQEGFEVNEVRVRGDVTPARMSECQWYRQVSRTGRSGSAYPDRPAVVERGAIAVRE